MTISFDDDGAGPALLFVHGHPFNRTMWRPQTDYLVPRGFRVVAPDLRGYGRTRGGGTKTSLERFAGDLIAVLDHLSVERAVMVGLSMGGQIVMELYRLFSHRCAALVLADTSARAETERGRRERYDMADRLEREGMEGYAREVLTKMVAPYNVESRPELARYVLEMMLHTDPRGAAAALRGRAERPDYVDMLRTLDVPALVVVGADDEFTPVADARAMHELIARSRLVTIDRAAHMPNLEQAERFNEAVHEFLVSLTW